MCMGLKFETDSCCCLSARVQVLDLEERSKHILLLRSFIPKILADM
jgi:hypothetical protein